MNYPIFIDIEASGLHSGASYPIQIAFNTEDGEIESFFVKPIEEWVYWDRQAEYVHQIKRETLFEQGKEITWVAERMNECLSGKRVYSDAVRFEAQWLDALYSAAKLERMFKLKELQDLAYRMKQYDKFEKISDQAWQLTSGQRHRADVDVLHHMKMFEIMKKIRT